MKRAPFFGLAASMMISSPAAAQTARAYTCTVNGTNETFQMVVGPQEWRVGTPGSWGANICDPARRKGVICTLQGSKFVLTWAGQAQFTFDLNSGAFFRLADGLFLEDDERGTCRPS